MSPGLSGTSTYYWQRFPLPARMSPRWLDVREEKLHKPVGGLGWPGQVHNLQKAANLCVCAQCGGQLPAVVQRPGLPVSGNFTAGAITCTQFRSPVPLIHGRNVLQVFAPALLTPSWSCRPAGQA